MSYKVLLVRTMADDLSKSVYKTVELPFPPFDGLMIHFPGTLIPFFTLEKNYRYNEGDDCLMVRDYGGRSIIKDETTDDVVQRYLDNGWKLE